MTIAPEPAAASRYRPSCVAVSPSGTPGTGNEKASDGESEALSRRAAIEPSPTATKDQRPFAATPKGLPASGTMAVRTLDRCGAPAVAVVHPGVRSAPAWATGGAAAACAAGSAGAAPAGLLPVTCAPAGWLPDEQAPHRAVRQARAATPGNLLIGSWGSHGRRRISGAWLAEAMPASRAGPDRRRHPPRSTGHTLGRVPRR